MKALLSCCFRARHLNSLLPLILLMFAVDRIPRALAQELQASATDTTTGTVEVTVAFGDDTGAVYGVDSYAAADETDFSDVYWVAVGGALVRNGETVAASNNDCSFDDYDEGNCAEDENPWSIAVDEYSGLTAGDEYEIRGAASLGFYDDDGNTEYIDLSFPGDLLYVPLDLNASVPSISELSQQYALLGSSAQITVTGSYFLDQWPTQTPASPPAASDGLTFTVASSPAPTSTQMTVNYSISATASTGDRSFRLTNRFGTSNSVTFLVADPTPTISTPNLGAWNAGNQYNVTIQGQYFGADPIVSMQAPSGVSFTQGQGNNTQVPITLTVPAGVAAGPVIVTITSRGESGDGFVGPEPQSATATGSVQAVPAAAPTIVARPMYASALGQSGDHAGNCSTNPPVTSNPTTDSSGDVTYTQTVFVGQQINITGCASETAGTTVTGATWTPDPTTVSSANMQYNATTATGGFVVTMNSDTFQFAETITSAPSVPTCSTGQSCDFPTLYFIQPGTYAFQFQYTQSNGSTSPFANAIFVVNGPTPDPLGHYFEGHNCITPSNCPPIQPGPVQVYASGQYLQGNAAQPYLADGDGGTTYAIYVQPTLTPPTGSFSSSSPLLVQTIGLLSLTYRSAPPTSAFNLQPGLDTVYAADTSEFKDAPGMPLDATGLGKTNFTLVGEESYSAEFTIYLLWDPGVASNGTDSCDIASASFFQGQNGPTYTQSTCASIPVPLESLTWSFDGDAIKTLNPNQLTAQGSVANSWYLAEGSAASPQFGPAAYPTWTFTENASQFNQ